MGRMDTEIFPFPRPPGIFRVSSCLLLISKRMPSYKSVQIRTHPYYTTPSPLCESRLPREGGVK